MAVRPPDVVLLDIEMPRMDGFECLREMRADPRFAHTLVIVATGREDVAAVDRAFSEGATSFVVKPLNWRLLSHQIRYIYRSHRAERALAEGETQARTALNAACQAGSRFLATALRMAPHLAGEAEDYLAALARGARLVGVEDAA